MTSEKLNRFRDCGRIFGVLCASRARLGVAFIAVYSVIYAAKPLISGSPSYLSAKGRDFVKYQAGFAQLKQYLPSDRVVSYSDDFISQTGKECDAFVLAQYALAPTVLETMCSQCGYMAKTEEVSAQWSGLLLVNVHDPKVDPYLLNLFPAKYFDSQSKSMVLTPGQLFPTNQFSLVQDFGHGVRLYEIEDK